MTDAYRTCPWCKDEQVMPAAWRGAPIGDVMTRMHEAICDDYLTIAARALIAEVELHLQAEAERCPHIRIVNGHTFRCRHTIGKCGGAHYMVRTDGAT